MSHEEKSNSRENPYNNSTTSQLIRLNDEQIEIMRIFRNFVNLTERKVRRMEETIAYHESLIITQGEFIRQLQENRVPATVTNTMNIARVNNVVDEEEHRQQI